MTNTDVTCGLIIPMSLAPSPVIDIRIHDGMIMQNVFRFEDADYVWDREEGWFDISDDKGVHGAFCMKGDGFVSFFLKNGEPVISCSLVKEYWDALEERIRDNNNECHRKILKLKGYL